MIVGEESARISECGSGPCGSVKRTPCKNDGFCSVKRDLERKKWKAVCGCGKSWTGVDCGLENGKVKSDDGGFDDFGLTGVGNIVLKKALLEDDEFVTRVLKKLRKKLWRVKIGVKFIRQN